MLVSVIVPIYNVEKYLSQCLESIVNQSYRELEIILVDDGSTDGSVQTIELFSKSDDRIKVIYQNNLGASAARNAGISIAKGEYIVFVDSDDWLDTGIVELALEKAINGFDLVFWGYNKVFLSNVRKGNVWFNEDRSFNAIDVRELLLYRIIGPNDEEMLNLMSLDNFSMPWSKLYRRDIIEHNNVHFRPTQEVASEDLLFNFDYLIHCKQAFFLNKTGYYYRKFNSNSLTKNHNNTLYKRLITLHEVFFQRIKTFELPIEVLGRLNNRRAISFVNVSLAICSKRNPQGFWDKYKEISKLVDAYKLKVASLKFRKLKLHWLLFFLMLRMGLTAFLFVYIYAVRLLVNR